MSFMLWNDSYTIGISKIDDDHKKLVDFINRLHMGLLQGDVKAEIQTILEGLLDYTRLHFKREEVILVEQKYPDYDNHCESHKKFIAKVVDFYQRYNDGKSAFSLELMSFLKDWLIEHIMGEDRKYKDFFDSKGIEIK